MNPIADDILNARRQTNAKDATDNPTPIVAGIPAVSGPAAILKTSRVDLVDLIRNGIPEPAYVPGCAPWLLAGKRYLMPAPAGTGKSIAGLVISVASVGHGGTVAILDVENGADEYARRLEDILTARDPDSTLADACRQRLHYHAWPQLSLNWASGEWAGAFDGTDLVIFDSSRLALSSVGLAEDKADDYSRFVNSLVLPLARAGTTTLVLDNTGHTDQERARGTSSKADLNEVVYALKLGTPFDRDRAGHLRLLRTRSRFAGLPGELHIHLGGNSYTAPTDASPDGGRQATFRPTGFMERISIALETNPGLSRTAIRSTVGGKATTCDLALELLISEGHVEAQRDGQASRHSLIKPYREVHDQANPVPLSQPRPNPVPDRVLGDPVPLSPP